MLDKKELIEHTKIFENRILEELAVGFENLKKLLDIKLDSPNIHTVVLDKDNFDYDYFLFKVVEDKEDEVYVYIDKSYYELQEIENKEYIGIFKSNDEEYRFKYVYVKDDRYDEKIEKIYKAFLLSNLRWHTIDKRHINRMYKIKIIEYLDFFEDIEGFNILYDVDNDFHFNKRVYWNIEEKKLISRQKITRLEDISYVYGFDLEKDFSYLFNLDTRYVEDVCYFENEVKLYSKYDDLYIFDIFKVHKLDERLIKSYTSSILIKDKLISIENIKRFLKNSYNIEVNNISYEDQEKTYLLIPKYNSNMNIPTTKIYLKLISYKDYDDVFHAINTLNYYFKNYEFRLYE